MNFEIIGDIVAVEIIAVENSIREIERLRAIYGAVRWRKMKGIAQIRFADGRIVRAEIHWYEALGIGKKEFKIKRILKD